MYNVVAKVEHKILFVHTVKSYSPILSCPLFLLHVVVVAGSRGVKISKNHCLHCRRFSKLLWLAVGVGVGVTYIVIVMIKNTLLTHYTVILECSHRCLKNNDIIVDNLNNTFSIIPILKVFLKQSTQTIELQFK